MKPLLLLGGGGHCRSVIDVIEAGTEWQVVGIVEQRGYDGPSVSGYPIVGCDDELAQLRALSEYAFVTVGQLRSPHVRQRLYLQAKAAGFSLPSLLSPLAHVARSAQVAEGVAILHYAHVGPHSHIGANTIINTRATVEHDVHVAAHCHISTAAVLNGGVSVGEGSFIGSGSICREGVMIGRSCVIGMGSLVRKALSDDQVFYGRN